MARLRCACRRYCGIDSETREPILLPCGRWFEAEASWAYGSFCSLSCANEDYRGSPLDAAWDMQPVAGNPSSVYQSRIGNRQVGAEEDRPPIFVN